VFYEFLLGEKTADGWDFFLVREEKGGGDEDTATMRSGNVNLWVRVRGGQGQKRMLNAVDSHHLSAKEMLAVQLNEPYERQKPEVSMHTGLESWGVKLGAY